MQVCIYARHDACMDVCMHACRHVCMHGCMHACICHACMHVCMDGCMHTCMYVCMQVCMRACVHACMHVCMYVHLYVFMHTHTYIHTYIHTHTTTQTYTRTYIHSYIHIYIHTYIRRSHFSQGAERSLSSQSEGANLRMVQVDLFGNKIAVKTAAKQKKMMQSQALKRVRLSEAVTTSAASSSVEIMHDKDYVPCGQSSPPSSSVGGAKASQTSDTCIPLVPKSWCGDEVYGEKPLEAMVPKSSSGVETKDNEIE